jgi:hypothetical protein
MEKIKFCEEEVLGFLEDIIISGEADQDELELYENYIWNGKLHKMNYTYKNLIMEMRKLYEVKF